MRPQPERRQRLLLRLPGDARQRAAPRRAGPARRGCCRSPRTSGRGARSRKPAGRPGRSGTELL